MSTGADEVFVELGVPLGARFADRYIVEAHMGAGGMGVVFKARDTVADRFVVVKLMRPERALEEVSAKRFQREAQFAATIASPHIARVIDQGALADSTPFMVLEFLEGRDLLTRLEEEGRLPLQLAIDYTLQTLAALAAAHAMGVVHRDIKPSNLFSSVDSAGVETLKVLDFGISKPLDSRSEKLTAARTAMGTPTYMAPEQIRAAPDCDHRMDIWAVGVVLYELITGMVPFAGKTPGQVFKAVLTDEIGDPSAMRRGIPPEVGQVVLRCLDRDPARRFQTAHDVMVALRPFASPQAQALVPEDAPSPPAPPPVRVAQQLDVVVEKHTPFIYVGAVLVGCVVASLAYWLLL